MNIWINGEALAVPAEIATVADLLKHLGLDGKIAVVEVNLNILNQGEHEAARLAEGDRVEIVHFVGGG